MPHAQRYRSSFIGGTIAWHLISHGRFARVESCQRHTNGGVSRASNTSPKSHRIGAIACQSLNLRLEVAVLEITAGQHTANIAASETLGGTLPIANNAQHLDPAKVWLGKQQLFWSRSASPIMAEHLARFGTCQ